MRFLRNFLRLRKSKLLSPALALSVPCRIIKIQDVDTAKEAEIVIPIKIRYDKCWGLELKQEGGIEGREAAREVEGKEGTLYIDLEDADNLADLFTFGRVIGEFFPMGSNESESRRMVRLGYASTTKGGKLGE